LGVRADVKKKYSDEFKLMVIQDYYQSQLGVRSIALKHNLPSKNYINKWEAELKKKGLLPAEATKPEKAVARSKESLLRKDTRTTKEKQYEEEILALKAKVAYYESLESLKPFISKKKQEK
jgi:transposase-like protein